MQTVTAQENIDVSTGVGQVKIYGKTSTQDGDISMSAGADAYTEGSQNFIIEQNGLLQSGRDINLTGRNGDLHVTDDIQAARDLNVHVDEKGSIFFDTAVSVSNDLVISTNSGSITVGQTVSSDAGSVSLTTASGDVLLGKDVTAEKDVAIVSGKGNIVIGDVTTGDDGDVLSKTGNVSIRTDEGSVGIVKTVTAQQGSVGIASGQGDILIGNNGPDVKTVTAQENIDVGTGVGQIKIYGKTSTQDGDISMSAGANAYTKGARNFIIEQNGLLESGRDITLTGRNGDLHVTDAIQASRDLNTQVNEQGGVYFDRDANLKGDFSVNIADGDVSMQNLQAEGNVSINVGLGNLQMQDMIAGGDAYVSVQNGDISLHDVTAEGNATVMNTGRGSINADSVTSGEVTHVERANGDLYLNVAEGRAVLVHMGENTEASRVDNILAKASGGSKPDVELTGKYIHIGSLVAKEGDYALQISAMGAGNEKLIAGDITVESLRSRLGSQQPSLWANQGSVHVDEGDAAIADVLAVDKIHLDNVQTTLAVYGRTPTRDGEQLVYWNNLDWTYGKQRGFLLYANGMLGTSGAVLIDAERNYGKLYGDNLSVVDMMRERVTNVHGSFTFDSNLLTEPGNHLRGVVNADSVQTDFQHKIASDQEISIERRP